MNPITIQEGRDEDRTLVYLLHVGDAKPNARYPKSTFDAIREACGPDATIVIRGDDGTSGPMPVFDLPRDLPWSRLVLGGWSAGVRGIRRLLIECRIAKEIGLPTPLLDVKERIAGIVVADGLHAPWAERRNGGLSLGPSEVFREYVERARSSWCSRCQNYRDIHAMQGFDPECYVPCPACASTRPFGFVLTHCMQTYMEAKNVSPRYLSTSTVARELTGWPCTGATTTLDDGIEIRQEGRLEVHSYAGPKVDYAGHVRQLREALPAALGRLRGMGVL